MAKTILRSSLDYQLISIKALIKLVGLLCLSMSLMQKSCNAREFTISWSADQNAANYNQWAQKNRFQIGDSIVFNYNGGQDSVLEVSQEDYNNCTTDNPHKKFDDGHTVFTFKQSGPHYFISGNKDNCLKNEKVIVIVLAERSNQSTTSPPPSEASTPPSPAPSGEVAPSPPPETNPTPAPSGDQTPAPSAASTLYMSFLGCIGVAFVHFF